MKPACSDLHNKEMNKACGFHGEGSTRLEFFRFYLIELQRYNQILSE